VTHYDIKCDNILIDFKANGRENNGTAAGGREEYAVGYTDEFSITVGDFGECRMYSGDKDEFSSDNRGTALIKSPEMLMLAINTRKELDRYDRRKRVGTNSLSDVWSLGCLLYELLTGENVFESEEFIYLRLFNPNEPLFSQEKFDKINNNVYLIDFLKYILVRDMRMRPTIDNVLKRFEHVHALLVATSLANSRFNRLMSPESVIS